VNEVPCTPGGEADWTQRTALGGVDFLLRFRWSQREGHWLLTLSDADGAPIVSGVVLVVGAYLLRGVADTRRPAGELLVVDVSGANDVDPAFEDLGDRFALLYLEPSEVT
jgi:hypothetical protein